MPEDFFGADNQWMILIPIIILIVFTFFFRRRKAEGTELEITASLLSDVNQNLKLVEAFGYQVRAKKFKTGSWERNSEKLGFLNRLLLDALSEAFSLAEDFNQEIEQAKRYKSTSYLSGISVSRLQEPLTKSKQGLEEWLKANMEKAGPDAGRRGCLGGGLGG